MQVVKKEMAKARLQAEDAQDQLNCAVCFENRRDCLYMPCMHLATCGECDKELEAQNQSCPMCQTQIQSRIRNVNIAA